MTYASVVHLGGGATRRKGATGVPSSLLVNICMHVQQKHQLNIIKNPQWLSLHYRGGFETMRTHSLFFFLCMHHSGGL